ncbi:MAG: 1-acyl-sn-glycerol-3-phosphate acyltransferase [Actinobacteria bacterium]|nr:1-acyl-sn-glycerol-3-phosphate acyltransferase [Actinomycetota bacterium]
MPGWSGRAPATIPGWGPGFAFGTWLGRRLFPSLFRLAFHQLAYVPREGPCIMVSNHLSNFDPLITGSWLPRRCTFVGKTELFSTPGIGWFCRMAGAVPVRRDGMDLAAVRTLLRVLARGGMIALYPEGTRSRAHALRRPVGGAAYLAVKANAPLLPVGILGTEQFGWNAWFRQGRFPVTVRFGPPFRIPAGADRSEGPDLDAIGDDIMRHIAALLPASYRGAYADAAGAPDWAARG